MHYSIWKGLSPSGGKRRTCNSRDCWPEESQKSIEKDLPSRPTGLYVWSNLKLGLRRVPLNYRSIIIYKQYKKMDSPAGEKGKKLDLRRPPASGSERFVWNVLLLPELSDQPISSGTSVLGRLRDHWLVEARGSLWPIIYGSIRLAAPASPAFPWLHTSLLLGVLLLIIDSTRI